MAIENLKPGQVKKARIYPARFEKDAELQKFSEFYLNPNTWTETKSSLWIKHKIPGQSDPVQQWTTGDARTITFEALVTLDLMEGVALRETPASLSCSATGKTQKVDVIGGIAQQVAEIADLTTQEVVNEAKDKSGKFDLDINAKLNYYRSLAYPNVFGRGGRVKAPDPVRLDAGLTFGNRTKSALFVVDRIDIVITKQMEVNGELKPIEATVSFTMTELVTKVLSSDTDIRKAT